MITKQQLRSKRNSILESEEKIINNVLHKKININLFEILLEDPKGHYLPDDDDRVLSEI